MSILKKTHKEEKLDKPIDMKLCECGEPIAKDLGQSDVCAKHIRTR